MEAPGTRAPSMEPPSTKAPGPESPRPEAPRTDAPRTIPKPCDLATPVSSRTPTRTFAEGVCPAATPSTLPARQIFLRSTPYTHRPFNTSQGARLRLSTATVYLTYCLRVQPRLSASMKSRSSGDRCAPPLFLLLDRERGCGRRGGGSVNGRASWKMVYLILGGEHIGCVFCWAVGSRSVEDVGWRCRAFVIHCWSYDVDGVVISTEVLGFVVFSCSHTCVVACLHMPCTEVQTRVDH